VSQDPLARLRRRDRREPRQRSEFPDPRYAELILEPHRKLAEDQLADAAIDVYRAHAVMLAERRVVEAAVAAALLRGLNRASLRVDASPTHPLSRVDEAAASAGGEIRLGTAREEVTLTAHRIVLRGRLLSLFDSGLGLRDTLAAMALQHLTTVLPATANGQVVQPTSLGHYLAGQAAPLARTADRLRETFERLNTSPMGSVSGMATAVPVHRGRQAELLGFGGPIESTFDAIAGGDVVAELAGVVALMATELVRLVADLAHWARDDVGTMAPSDAFVHRNDSQPQRREPQILDHLRVRLMDVGGVPQRLTSILTSRSMLGGEATAMECFRLVERQCVLGTETIEVLGAVLSTAEVNRSLFANRAHRGFATSSELVDLLSIDYQIPRDQAVVLVERIVTETIEAGGDATTLRTELIDQIALRTRGVEVGIEPETLAKALAPKRFLERRDHPGGPAPSAVRQSVERETFAVRQDRIWLEDRRRRLDEAAATLMARSSELIEAGSVAGS
jgi:argininosuccinate lyase